MPAANPSLYVGGAWRASPPSSFLPRASCLDCGQCGRRGVPLGAERAAHCASHSRHSPAPAPTLPPPTTSLPTSDLDKEVTEAQLFSTFSPFGTITSLRICRDAITRKSLGYAYVNFSAASDGA